MAERVLRFRVGSRRWVVPLGVVREVLERPAMLRVPGSRTRVAGVALRKGVVLPIYDLGQDPEPPPYVVVIEWGEMLNGLRVRSPEAGLPIAEEEGDLGAPCRGRMRFRDGAAEKVDLNSLYRLLEIPIHD